jgi:hypothetical protein
VFSFLLSGCAVTFVSAYDPVTDAAIQKSAEKAETIIADVLGNGTAWKAHATHWRELHGSLAAVSLRAGLYGEKNKAEQEVVSRLQQASRDLEELHREVGPFRPAEAAGVRSLFRSLMHHELSKKRSTALASPDATP